MVLCTSRAGFAEPELHVLLLWTSVLLVSMRLTTTDVDWRRRYGVSMIWPAEGMASCNRRVPRRRKMTACRSSYVPCRSAPAWLVWSSSAVLSCCSKTHHEGAQALDRRTKRPRKATWNERSRRCTVRERIAAVRFCICSPQSVACHFNTSDTGPWRVAQTTGTKGLVSSSFQVHARDPELRDLCGSMGQEQCSSFHLPIFMAYVPQPLQTRVEGADSGSVKDRLVRPARDQPCARRVRMQRATISMRVSRCEYPVRGPKDGTQRGGQVRPERERGSATRGGHEARPSASRNRSDICPREAQEPVPSSKDQRRNPVGPPMSRESRARGHKEKEQSKS
ncbi:hypothetical protein L227DRAFT_409001 [Lentinus tigrinus ALCF2SS1-6]|uniref:Uncharacterized protein n=1 Tax=Lentinus tigrinus ALCF2SS1-6 TaxID=1328759 RepID=A0A5C2SH02_9APHY|nr:hypothetical protein L227DRAFT_409001 [Lentinus tigrinus ALCF2SS1-6]